MSNFIRWVGNHDVDSDGVEHPAWLYMKADGAPIARLELGSVFKPWDISDDQHCQFCVQGSYVPTEQDRKDLTATVNENVLWVADRLHPRIFERVSAGHYLFHLLEELQDGSVEIPARDTLLGTPLTINYAR